MYFVLSRGTLKDRLYEIKITRDFKYELVSISIATKTKMRRISFI